MRRAGRPAHHWLLRDLLLLAGSGLLLLGVSVGLYRLLAPPRLAGRPAAELDNALRPLFRRALLLQEKTLANPRLERLTAAVLTRLQEAADAPAEVEVLVLDSPQVNAFAFPGGLVAVHRGLLARLEGPEELAAVLAHELGHVARRDSLAGLSRALGLSLLLSLATGGSQTVLRDVVERAFTLRYTRAAEERADRYALDLLVRARLDPARFADALGRLDSGGPPGFLRYLDSHPDPAARLERARRRSAEASVAEEPLAAEWPRELFTD